MTIPDAFFEFDGSAGLYLKKEDVNLLDANASHSQQAVGWIDGALTIAASSYTLVADSSALFGDNVLRMDCPGAAANEGGGVYAIPVPASSAVTVAVRFRSSLAVPVQLRCRTNGGTDSNPNTTPAADTWTWIAAEVTTDASNPLDIALRYNPAAGAQANLDIDVAIVLAGTGHSFPSGWVPSLRIVGDLSFFADLKATDWTPGSSQYIGGSHDFAAQTGYTLYMTGAGPTALWGVAGVGTLSKIFTGWSVADGVRATLGYTRDAGSGVVKTYQNGVELTSDTFASGALDPSTTRDLVCAAYVTGSNNLAAEVHSLEVRDGIGGPVVARFDPDDRLGL